jgi:short-subunit dehydrogenase
MSESLKYALVTGASSGIGWHIAKQLAAKGYGIIAVSNQGKELGDLRSELVKLYQVSVLTLDLDLSRSDAAAEVSEFCRQNKLQVEVLVNNAGILVYGEVMEADAEKVSEILSLHMNTPVLLCRLFGRQMQERQKGYILNISSISAVMPYPTIALYGPTKTFLRKFTCALRHEMKGSGVHVTCMLPGATATAMYEIKHLKVPLGMRLGIIKKAENVAKAGVKAVYNNRPVRIPGLINKFVVYFFPLIPPFLIQAIYKWVRRKRLKKQV